jgi:hypothetical protein
MPVSKYDINVALMTYADDTLLEFGFKESFSAAGIMAAVSRAQYVGGPANLAQALDALRTRLIWSTSQGYRGGHASVVIIGDGPVGVDTLQAADNLLTEGVSIFAVGMGEGNMSALSLLLHRPENLFVPNSIELLRDEGFAAVIAQPLSCTMASYVTGSPLLDPPSTDAPLPTATITEEETTTTSYNGAPVVQSPDPQGQSSGSSGSSSNMTLVMVVASIGGVALVAGIGFVVVRRNMRNSEDDDTVPGIVGPPLPRRLAKKKNSDYRFDLTWENEFAANPGLQGSMITMPMSSITDDDAPAVVRRHATGTSSGSVQEY